MGGLIGLVVPVAAYYEMVVVYLIMILVRNPTIFAVNAILFNNLHFTSNLETKYHSRFGK